MLYTVSLSVPTEVLERMFSSIVMQEGQGQDDKKPIKWASMIPQIGGSAIGCKKATGVDPVFNLSYSVFEKNDNHLRDYWPHVHHLLLDRDGKGKGFMKLIKGQEIDFVTTICPCAGLSRLNVSKTRGSDAEQNFWIMETAKFTLENIKPKVLWGENAPDLFMKDGKDLVMKLRELGKLHGYSFSMVKTNTQLHGLPQRRMRTFYFFWKSPTIPMLKWKSTQHKPLKEYLAEIPKSATLQDVLKWPGKASEMYLPYKFVLQKEGVSHSEFSKKVGRTTIAKYIEDNGMIEECLDWLRSHHPRASFPGYGKKTFIQVFEHIKSKLSNGKGYWDDSVRFMGDSFTAVISKNIEFAVHPTEDRFFSVRELLHLMGMPHDFQMPAETAKTKINSICQNVPVNTARDWADEVIAYCRGEANMTNLTFLKQNNIDQTIVETSEHSPEHMKKQRKRKSVAINRVMKKLKTDIKEEVKNELKEELLELKRESVSGIKLQEVKKEEIEVIELDDENENIGAGYQYPCGLCVFKSSSPYSLQAHWERGCPSQTKGILECGVCLQQFRTLLDISTHWQATKGCWSRPKRVREDKGNLKTK